MNYIDLININVYLSNILLIPSIVLIYLIYHNSLKFENSIYQQEYSLYWFIIFIIFSIGFILSSIHHFFMFSDYSILKKIGKIDSKISAPILSIILIFLNFIYLNFSLSDCPSSNVYATIPIFIIAVTLLLIGGFVFIIKKIAMKTNKCITNDNTCCYLSAHTFFHYTAYTGALLTFLLFYNENKNIYKYVFQNEYCSNS